MTVAERSLLVGVGLVVVANICFSAKAILIKLMYRQGVPIFDVIALRMLLALPFYIATAIHLYRQPSNVRLTLHEWTVISGLGILSYYVSSMLDFWGLQYVTAGVERLILYTYPTLVVLFSALFFGKAVTRVQYMALATTYVGVYIAFAAEQGLGTQPNAVLGGLLILLCSTTYALYVVWTGAYVHRTGAAKFTSYAVMAATVPALVQSVLYNGMDIFHYPAPIWQLGLLIAVVSTVIPTFMIVEGIRVVGANNAGIIGSVGPVSTILMAWLFLGEPVTPMQLCGTVVVLIGVAFLTWKGKE